MFGRTIRVIYNKDFIIKMKWILESNNHQNVKHISDYIELLGLKMTIANKNLTCSQCFRMIKMHSV